MATLCYKSSNNKNNNGIRKAKMYNTKTLLPNIVIAVVNSLGVLLACCKNFSLTLLIHKNDIETKPGYKTDLKDGKTFKW